MNWLPLGKVISLNSQRKWTEPSDKSWFKFEFSPATQGYLEVSQGDGNLTIGTPIYFPSDRSPVALQILTSPLIQPQSKRLELYSEQRLKVRVFTLDVEPTVTDAMTLSNNLVSTIAISRTVDSTTESTTLLEANSNRKGATIYNRSDATLFIDFDNDVSITDYATPIPSMGYYEVPFIMQSKITGVWAFENGNAFVRELT